MTTADCGCWTDASGYWRLSDECRKVEREVWAQAVNMTRDERMDIIHRDHEKSKRDRITQYFRQELGDDPDAVQARARIERGVDTSDIEIYTWKREGGQ